MGRDHVGLTQVTQHNNPERGGGGTEEREKMGSCNFKNISNNNNNNVHGHGYRGRPYALMLLLAFGAAILGLMVLHKLREKRIINVLVKEKDHELLSLQLLFQREKEFNKEARRKIEEMKTKVSTLRSQKLELERKVSDMESTVQTLRDERNVLESTLEEKKNEIEELKILLEKAIDAQAANNNASTAFESFGTQEETETDTVVITNSTKDQQQGRSGDEGVVERDKEPDKLNDSATDAGTNKEEGAKKQTVDKTEQLGNKTIDSQTNQTTNETRIKKEDERKQSTGRSDDPRDEEESFRRGGVKLEKSDRSEFEHGSRVRRSHSNGKKWREIVRNRRMGQSLYSVSKGAEVAVMNHSSDGKTETVTTRAEELKKGAEGQEKRSKLDSNGEEALNKESVEKSYELMRYKSENQQASEEPEKMQRKDETEHASDNEQRDVEKDEAEVEDVEEDAETIEPEIDRADIQRFSESDHDEETEEQEPEF